MQERMMTVNLYDRSGEINNDVNMSFEGKQRGNPDAVHDELPSKPGAGSPLTARYANAWRAGKAASVAVRADEFIAGSSGRSRNR